MRSARPYYLDFASEFNALYGHVGSSPAAYNMLRKNGVDGLYDLDQWYQSQYYVSKQGRARPHHLYTSTELLGRAYNEMISPPFEGGARGGLESWQFKNDAPTDLRGNISDISVGYVAPYTVRWSYDKFENHYTRIQWARPNFSAEKVSVGYDEIHKDENGKPIIAKNIAVAFMEMKVLDQIGRKEFKTIGEGEALVFQDGKVVVGTWKKPSARERLRFYHASGSEVQFNAGVSWVEIVPVGYKVKY
ncbi:MAG: DUF3048 C-terminal domain-containing protein [bacterium]|nr:DUF3048 C-terminal domain-containing protein [bacterium]